MNTKIFTKNELSEAAAMIRNGGVVAMPTETVYGLAANAFDEEAVKKIFLAKGRQSDNPLIVHISKISDWQKLVSNIPEKAKLLVERFWPGPLTIVLKKSAAVPDIVSGGLDTVAVRMPKHKIAFNFIKECGVPIAAPSANLSGSPSPTKFSHVFHDMNGKIDGIIDGGDCMVGVESTVISLVEETPVILRPGRITAEQIRKVIGDVAIHHSALEPLESDEAAASPGMKYKHYAPKAALTLIDADDAAFEAYVKAHADEKTAVICHSDNKENLEAYHPFILGAKHDSVAQAKRLFDILRAIDEKGFEKALCPLPVREGVGLAVNNRLLRASGYTVIKPNAPADAELQPADTEAEAAAEAPQPESIVTKSAADQSALTKELVAKRTADEPIKEAATALQAQEQAPVQTDASEIIGLESESAVEPVSEPQKANGKKKKKHKKAKQAAKSLENQDTAVTPAFAIEEDSAILALSDVQLSADFDQDFSKAISDSITIIERTEEDNPEKIFYEAVIDNNAPRPAAYPVDDIGEDFKFDVYDDDIRPKRRGLFSRLFGKDEPEETEPEPFLPQRDPVWSADRAMLSDEDVRQLEKLESAQQTAEKAVYEKIPGIRVVGITGKSGAGKTFITGKLAAKEEGSYIIEADKIYHAMLESDSMILSIVIAFGNEVLNANRKIDRKKLARIAFASEESLQKLNETVLPAVAKEIIGLIEQAKQKGAKTVFIDAPTLIESKLNQVCNEVIFVTADPAIRQERIVDRDNITLDEIGQRMRFEKPDAFYVKYADRIIRND